MSDQKNTLNGEQPLTPDEKPEVRNDGIKCGTDGIPFWNPVSYQFMYAPRFQFQRLPGVKKYRYTAKDETGALHTFDADKATASLAPVWEDIPEGVVTLNVTALDAEGSETYPVGTRTFFRLAPFSEDLPGAVCGYREASRRAYEYALGQPVLKHWLTDGTPDPDYDHNVYPSKMIAAIITSMIQYARLCPERASEALTIARNAADYLIGITAKDGPMKGIPPTYQIDFRPDPETRNNLHAAKRIDWVMMIYPATVGRAYLKLAAETNDVRYRDAAFAIARFFRDTADEEGGWALIRNIHTGEVLSDDRCEPMAVIVPFLMEIYGVTKDEEWKKMAGKAISYVEKTSLTTYSWGAQFEDSDCSRNYNNLTHYPATAMIRYYLQYFPADEKKLALCDSLMRFVEDQFVIWKRPSPWNRSGYDTSLFHTPCGLEQYNWHVPIDASTGDILLTFLAMYKAGRGEIYRKKAMALADSITRAQQENGMIPTHWMNEKFMKGAGLWINCLFCSANALKEIGDFLGK